MRLKRARNESFEHGVKRLRDLADHVTTFDGVRQAYTIDAKMVDDKISAKITRDIAKKIQAGFRTRIRR